jgi:asparagine synthase (glutamine-hydrolysing)
VNRHLISDAPIGLFLSGGIDSSLLTILAKQFIPENLRTISIVFENEAFSEKIFQDIIIEKTGAKHKSFLVTEKMFYEHLDDIVSAMDQPSSDGINTYFICKFAKEYGLKAALSGLGADELFGGYQSFYRARAIGNFKWMPAFMYRMAGLVADDRVKKIEFLAAGSSVGTYLLHRGLFAPSQVARILDCTEQEVTDALRKIGFITPQFVNQLPGQEKISFLENLYMQNQLLKDTDYMSMWHGIEVRVPFLDKELTNILYSIAPEIRYNSSQIKYLLVEAFKDLLPEPIWNRSKQGFTFPLAHWMKQVNPVREDRKSLTMKRRMERDKIHWSRYWSYVLSQRAH